jgi:hypothetical protein
MEAVDDETGRKSSDIRGGNAMIKTSKQLKDKVKNLSASDSTKAQTLIRNFIMERFWREFRYHHIKITLS